MTLGKEVVVILDIFKINQRLEIMIDIDSHAEQYPSRIEEIQENRMIIAMPMTKGYPKLLHPGARFHGRVVTNGVVYRFTSNLIDKRLQPLPVWITSLPYDITKIQQRAFVRIEAFIPVEITVLSNENNLELNNIVTKDISGGGLRIVSKQQLPVNTNLKLIMDIPTCGVIEANGEVVRIEEPSTATNIFWLGIKFINLSEKDRSKIIKYIFKKQLERRQKGF